MRSRLDLLHPKLQGKLRTNQIQMKETHSNKRHERTFTPGMYVCQELSNKIVDRSCVICRRQVDHLRSRRADSDSTSPVCQRGQVDTYTETTPQNSYRPFSLVLTNRDGSCASIPNAPIGDAKFYVS